MFTETLEKSFVESLFKNTKLGRKNMYTLQFNCLFHLTLADNAYGNE